MTDGQNGEQEVEVEVEVEEIVLDDLDEKDIDDMSYEEVEAVLAASKLESEEEKPEEDDSGTPEEEEDQPEEESKEEVSAFVFDDSEYVKSGWNQDQIDIIQKKEEQIFNKENFIKKQSTEIGESRKKEASLKTKEKNLEASLESLKVKEEELKEDFDYNPEAYNKVVSERMNTQNDLSNVSNEIKNIDKEGLVISNIPDFDTLLKSGIEDVIREDAKRAGWDSEKIDSAVKEFKSGGWKNLDANQTIVIADRARSKNKIKEQSETIKNLSKKPDNIGKKIAKVANQRPIVKTNSASTETSKDVDDMSYDELTAFLNKAKNKK